MLTMKKSALVGVAALFALGACATDPSQIPGTDGNRTQEGAIAGAILGGVLGAATGSGSRGDDIITGAVIGGVAGGITGNILDRQAQELRSQLGNEVGVINTGDALIVRLPNDILFDVNSTVLKGTLRSDLLVLADSLNKYPASIVTVTGHTDSTGSAAFNQDLSERRAGAVANVLFNGGVSFNRVRTVGAGENQPIATNQTEGGRAQNRRVDITITPTN